MDYDKLMKEARQVNAERDKLDGLDKLGAMDILITAMAAIEAGIKLDDWSCVAEGQAMLELIPKRVIVIDNQKRRK